MAKIEVLSREVQILTVKEEDYICITDIARYKDAERIDDLIRNWLRNRNTVEFLGIWEQINNPVFNPVEFDGIKKLAGLNSFTLTPKQWIQRTGAIGIISKAGRYGGTYAHKDIAFEFASWVSVEFKLYLIKEFQRLKEEEHKTLGWGQARRVVMRNIPALFVILRHSRECGNPAIKKCLLFKSTGLPTQPAIEWFNRGRECHAG